MGLSLDFHLLLIPSINKWRLRIRIQSFELYGGMILEGKRKYTKRGREVRKY